MIFKRLVTTYILIIVVALSVIGALVFSIVNTTIKEQFIYSNQLILNNGVDLITEYIDDNKDIALDIVIDPSVQRYLDNFIDRSDLNFDISYYANNDRVFRNKLKKYDAFVKIYGFDDEHVYEFKELENKYKPIRTTNWMDKTIELNGPFLLEGCEIDSKEYIRLSMVVSSVKNWPTHTGIIALYFKTEVMLSLFYNIRLENATVPYLVDDKGTIILPYENTYDIIEEDLMSQKADWWRRGNDVIINTPMKKFNWKLMGVLSENELLKRSRDIVVTFFIVGSVTVLALIMVCLYFSVWITRPISKLSKEMLYVEKKDFKPLAIKKTYAVETKQLYRQFNYMAQRINNLIDEVYKVKIKEKEAELLALQGQINPHFLYNTLDSIAWMSLEYNAEDIRHMVTSLASMMRYSLNEGNNLITVQDELEQIRNYVAIQEIRYDGKFKTEIKADKELLHFKIIKLIIQPLVENAIVHGFKATDHFGKIEVSVRKEEQNLVIRVINEGDEIDLDKVKELLAPNKKTKSRHYGLRNVNDRLIKKYGSDSAVTFEKVNNTTVAQINIPIRLLDKGDSNG